MCSGAPCSEDGGVNASADGGEDAGADSGADGSEDRQLVVLAQSPSPTDIVVDGTSVYFTSCPGAEAGAAPGALADGGDAPGVPPDGGAAMSVPLGGGGAAMSVPLGGGTATSLASTPRCSPSLALDGNHLFYVAGLDGGDVASVAPLGGGASTTVASDADPADVGVSSTAATSTDLNSPAGALMKAPSAAVRRPPRVGSGAPRALWSSAATCTGETPGAARSDECRAMAARPRPSPR